MQLFEQTNQKWRGNILRTNKILVLFVFIIESIVLIFLRYSGLEELPVWDYLRQYLFIPTGINVAILAAGGIANRYIQKETILNYLPILELCAICTTVAIVHNLFSVTFCIFVIPVFLSVIFNDKKMTRIVSLLCGVFLAAAIVFRHFAVEDVYLAAEAAVSYAIIFAANIVCNLLIDFQIEKNEEITQGYLMQLKMKDQLNRDAKTGLFGHTMLMNTLNKITAEAEKTGKPFALGIIDIDDFKTVNDSYGHAKGDQVIHALAEIMKKNCHENQLVARFGGEEFAVLFETEDLYKCYEVIDNIRNDFENLLYPFTERKITISCGVSQWREGLSPEEIFDNADAAMYLSKKEGKNKTTIK